MWGRGVPKSHRPRRVREQVYDPEKEREKRLNEVFQYARASYQRNPEKLQESPADILNLERKLEGIDDGNKDSLLKLAAETNKYELCRLLLRLGASTNNDIALRAAVSCADIRILKLFVANGADIMQVFENTGENFLRWAGSLEVLTFLCESGMNRKDIIDRPIVAGEFEMDAGPALHRYAKKGDIAMATYILDQGADIHAKSRNGETALHAWVDNGHHDGVVLLLGRGAMIEARDDDGKTPLLHSPRLSIISLLLAHGANIHAVDWEGKTALFYALSSVDAKPLTIMINHGADVDAVDNAGNNLLHTLASKISRYNIGNMLQTQEKAMLKAVLEMGVDPLGRNQKGQTARDVVCEHLKEHDSEIPVQPWNVRDINERKELREKWVSILASAEDARRDNPQPKRVRAQAANDCSALSRANGGVEIAGIAGSSSGSGGGSGGGSSSSSGVSGSIAAAAAAAAAATATATAAATAAGAGDQQPPFVWGVQLSYYCHTKHQGGIFYLSADLSQVNRMVIDGDDGDNGGDDDGVVVTNMV